MCAGDRSLYVDCYTMFEAMSKKWFFMGDVGTGARMKVIEHVLWSLETLKKNVLRLQLATVVNKHVIKLEVFVRSKRLKN